MAYKVTKKQIEKYSQPGMVPKGMTPAQYAGMNDNARKRAWASQKSKALSKQGLVSKMEQVTGIKAPTYENLRDPKTGALQSQYQYDPTKSAAFQKLQEQAMTAPGESPWARMQLDKQAFEQGQALDQSAQGQAQALAQAQAGLMRQGGLNSGQRLRMAQQGAKDLMLAQQGVRGQGVAQRLGIGEQDINRQADLLGRVSGTELEGQGKNLATSLGDVQSQRQFDLDKYQSQMSAFGADKTASAQAKAAKQKKK